MSFNMNSFDDTNISIIKSAYEQYMNNKNTRDKLLCKPKELSMYINQAQNM